MKKLLSLFLPALLFAAMAIADEFDARAVLGVSEGHNVEGAIKRAEKEKKRVLVFALDPKKDNQAFHIKGMLEFEETKKLVKENFLIVVTDFKEKTIKPLAAGEATDRPMYFLFDKDGKVIQKGTTAMGGSRGERTGQGMDGEAVTGGVKDRERSRRRCFVTRLALPGFPV
jgi:hypothetical protein